MKIYKYWQENVLSETPDHIKLTVECSFQSVASKDWKYYNRHSHIICNESKNNPFSETITTYIGSLNPQPYSEMENILFSAPFDLESSENSQRSIFQNEHDQTTYPSEWN